MQDEDAVPSDAPVDSNGGDTVDLRIRREDLPMMLSVLRTGRVTAMMCTGREGAAYRRIDGYAQRLKAEVPHVAQYNHDEHIWIEISDAMRGTSSWKVEVRDDPSYGFRREIVVICVGDREWTRSRLHSEKKSPQEEAEAIRAYLRELAPLGCEETKVEDREPRRRF